jgi:hypothetical protein
MLHHRHEQGPGGTGHRCRVDPGPQGLTTSGESPRIETKCAKPLSGLGWLHSAESGPGQVDGLPCLARQFSEPSSASLRRGFFLLARQSSAFPDVGPRRTAPTRRRVDPGFLPVARVDPRPTAERQNLLTRGMYAAFAPSPESRPSDLAAFTRNRRSGASLCTAISPYRPRSCQFGRASAPIVPHLVHTMRGLNVGTVRSPGRWSTLTITRCRH